MAVFILVLTLLASVLAFYQNNVYEALVLHPYSVSRGKRIYTIISSGFIHADWQHLAFNMVSYFFFAFDFERNVGPFWFLIIYLVSMALADIKTIVQHKDNYGYRSLGASGAISAIVFGNILIHPWQKMLIFPIPIPIPAIFFGLGYLIYCYIAARNSESRINHDAHLYGAISGLVITGFLFPEYVFRLLNMVGVNV